MGGDFCVAHCTCSFAKQDVRLVCCKWAGVSMFVGGCCHPQICLYAAQSTGIFKLILESIGTVRSLRARRIHTFQCFLDWFYCPSQEEKEVPSTAQAAVLGMQNGTAAPKASGVPNGLAPAAAQSSAPAAAPAAVQNGVIAPIKAQIPTGRPHAPPLTDAQLSALLIANGATPAAASTAVENGIAAKSGKEGEPDSQPSAALTAKSENGQTNEWLALATAAVAATDPAKRAKLGAPLFPAFVVRTCALSRRAEDPCAPKISRLLHWRSLLVIS